jgi:hypothetical protein
MMMLMDKLQRPEKLFCRARGRERAHAAGAKSVARNDALYRFTTLLVLKK